MVALSLSWVLAVDLIPASLRPYVGSTQNNSELSLAFGYNGLQRLTGGAGPSGSGGPPSGAGGPPGGLTGGPPAGGPPSGTGFPGGGNGPGPIAGGVPGGAGNGGASVGMFNTGNPGLFRLFTQPLAGQIVWLLPLALIGMLALAADRRFRPRADRQQQSLILWGTWLLTMVAIPAAVAAVALTIFRLRPSLVLPSRLRVGAVALGFAALLAVPTVWSAYPALANVTQDLPIAGLDSSGGPGGGSGSALQVNSALISYLEAHQGATTYLVATTSSNTSAPINPPHRRRRVGLAPAVAASNFMIARANEMLCS